MDGRTLTVGELGVAIRGALETVFPYGVWVEGEISDLSRARNGHVYFDLVERSDELLRGLVQEALNGLKKRQFPGVGVVAVNDGEKAHVGAYVAAERTDTYQAGKLIQTLAPIVGGRGGGKPEMARGAGSEPGKIDELLQQAESLLA